MTPEEVKEYWTRQAKLYGWTAEASWTDTSMMDLEFKAIKKWIKKFSRLLDVGCANGYTTFRLSEVTGVTIDAIDYIPEMIDSAKAAQKKMKNPNITFEVGDVRKLGFLNAYDTVVGIRVLINLPDLEAQLQAMNNCLDALKSGGLYLMSEATLDGWAKMNSLRTACGLSVIPIPLFNVYLHQQQVIDALKSRAELMSIENFSSTYFVGTRVLKAILLNGLPELIADPHSELNKYFATLPPYGDYGTQKLFVWKKK